MATRADADRMRLIASRLLIAGIEILWVPGWDTRGADWVRTPIGIVDHHDASSTKSGEWGSLGVIRDGRTGIPGPLSQFQIGRGLDGRPRVAIVAAGRANHAGKGGPMWAIPKDVANSWVYGAEAANDGVSEPYTPAANRAHLALFSSVAAVCGFPVAHVIGHKEWAPGRKSDPRYSMAAERAALAAGGAPTPTRRRDNMIETKQIDPGSGGARIVLPTGGSAVVTERAWISFAVNGPAAGKVRAWFQGADGKGISDTGALREVGFASGASKVVGFEVPAGTAQVAMQWEMPQGGTYTVEALARA